MIPVKTETYTSRGDNFELNVYQVQETGEYRIYISKLDNEAGDMYTASHEVVDDAQDIIKELISTAKDHIKRNEHNQF